MAVYCYQEGRREPLVEPVAHPAGVPAPVGTIWAYKDGQRHLVWSRAPMTLTASPSRWDMAQVAWAPPGAGADSYRLYRGAALIYSGPSLSHTDTGLDPSTRYAWRVEAVRGGVVVGEARASATTPALSMAPMTATAVSTSQIDVAWTNPGGFDTVHLRTAQGLDTALAANATSYSHTGLSASTTYDYGVDGLRGSQRWYSVATTSATTQGPAYEPKVVTLSRNAYGSYSGSGAKRTDTADLYFGQYSGTWGLQKWLTTFDIPADLRNCVSVDRVEVSVWNVHAFNNSGASVGLVVHHSSVAGSTFPGSRPICRILTAPKPGWWGGSEWIDVTYDAYPGGTTIAEEFRALGATGIGFQATTTAQSGYGYSRNDVRIRFHYTVRVA